MLIDLFISFLQIGLFGIGGGLVSVSLLMQQIVSHRQWLTAEAFNDLIAISESTPGPLVVNSSTFIGMQLAGLPGAIVATVASVLPGFLIALTISLLYRRYRTLSPIKGAMAGIRPIVIALIFVGGLKIMINALFAGGVLSLDTIEWYPVIMFVSCFFILRKWKINPVAVILGSGAVGLILYTPIRRWLRAGFLHTRT